MFRTVIPLFALLTLPVGGRASGADDDERSLPPPARVQIDYARHIAPILVKRCHRCHGPERQRGGLRLDVRQAAIDGGDSGPVLAPGNSAGSTLIRRVASSDPDEIMPPRGTPLSREEISLVRAWIDQGLAWTDAAGTADERRPESDHWSFQELGDPATPRVENTAWVRNPVDAFVLRSLERVDIEPSPEARATTLIRRLYLDLTGLPPPPSDVDEALRSGDSGAYERLVDRLLASPHFGERWARHWLDLARYADSDGYEKDRSRPHAWRYRNWVIDAINADIPFDRFTVEQLAGDLLEGATVEQRVATGFHRNTLTNTEGGTDKEEDRVKRTVDRTNTTGSVWLGLTVGCAQCHTHKYDPITQREYYQLYAFFNTMSEVDIEAPLPAERRAWRAYEAKLAALQSALGAKASEELIAGQARWEKAIQSAETDSPGAAADLPEDVRKILAVPGEKRSEDDRERLAAHYRANHPDVDPEIRALQRAIDAHRKTRPPAPSRAQALREHRPRRVTRVLTRGDFLRPGAPVEPDTLGVLPRIEPRGAVPDRLDLARWLMRPDHPLTSRVVANRIWLHLFGRGLVRSPEDFGTRGQSPTHPELLDWLARELMRQGWSLKRMVRTIVLSSTYRQRSDVRPDLLPLDPENRLLARQNRFRLEAEVVRDLFLTSSGLLTPAIGGPSVRPPLPPGVRELGYAGSIKWPVSTGAARYRRGLYIFFQRTVPYPMLTSFDAPDSNVSCLRRRRSNTPLQALTLLNDPVFHEAAQALGRRVVREASPGTVEGRLRHLFLLAISREPDPREQETLEALYNDLMAEYRNRPEDAARMLRKDGAATAQVSGETVETAAWIAVARVVLNLDEAVTRN